jgi:hypothetical protein
MTFCAQCGEELKGNFCSRCGKLHESVEVEAVSAAARELTQRFEVEYESLDSLLRVAFSDVKFAFLEALGACVDGRLLSAAVMGRTALEAALFLARIYEKGPGGAPIIHGSVIRILPETQFNYGTLRNWAKQNHLLDKSLANDCDKARGLGNFAAHYAEQVRRGMAKSIAQLSAQQRTANAARNGARVEMAPYLMWVAPEDAYWSLNVTRKAILRIARSWTEIED